MPDVMGYPLVVFVLSFIILVFSARAGAALRRRKPPMEGATREDFDVILAATLTLLGLIIGFTFSMAVSRYDQRKNLEEEEANAIGTAYLRADLLPAAEAARVRTLLKSYTEERVVFYSTRDAELLRDSNARTARLQAEMWATIRTPALLIPTSVSALAVAGMNDVINSQGYTQAAWWNRIPHAAWLLMFAIAICANVLLGFGARTDRTRTALIFVLPLVVSIAFLLIADIDSPRGGLIRLGPINLTSLLESVQRP